jgi:hypothetical protein
METLKDMEEDIEELQSQLESKVNKIDLQEVEIGKLKAREYDNISSIDKINKVEL